MGKWRTQRQVWAKGGREVVKSRTPPRLRSHQSRRNMAALFDHPLWSKLKHLACSPLLAPTLPLLPVALSKRGSGHERTAPRERASTASSQNMDSQLRWLCQMHPVPKLLNPGREEWASGGGNGVC